MFYETKFHMSILLLCLWESSPQNKKKKKKKKSRVNNNYNKAKYFIGMCKLIHCKIKMKFIIYKSNLHVVLQYYGVSGSIG